MIEIIKKNGSGYLSTFSPAGVLCGKTRYKNLLCALLKDFEFIKAFIFSGDNFENVSKAKPITFSIWKYHKNVYTDVESLKLKINELFHNPLLPIKPKYIQFKRMDLLKDGWKCDTMKYIRGELGVINNERFNSPKSKILQQKVDGGGSEMVEENIIKELNIPYIPSELVYGLWSTVVGNYAIIRHPLHFDGAYVHLPNFNKIETMEILTYSIMYAIIQDLKTGYYNNKNKFNFIGIIGIFKFGGNQLSKGVYNLLYKYGLCKIGDKTIEEIFEIINWHKKEIYELISNANKYLKLISEEVAKRLEKIGYWDYLPIPKDFKIVSEETINV